MTYSSNLVCDEYTQSVIDAIGDETTPRARKVLSSLVKHLHSFAKEIELGTDEWMLACDFVNRIGQISSERRNEAILVSDILGLESLVDKMAHEKAASGATEDSSTTYSAILGPFWRHNAPMFRIDDDIVTQHFENDTPAYMYGTITDSKTGKPLVGAEIDVWHCGPDGLYDSQHNADSKHFNMRGRILTDDKGHYGFYCLRPVPYPIPYDGPAGDLLKLQHRHPMRPAHIHLYVKKAGYVTLITQVFDRSSKYLSDDSVFAVKDSLLVDFVPSKKGHAKFEVHYPITLAQQA